MKSQAFSLQQYSPISGPFHLQLLQLNSGSPPSASPGAARSQAFRRSSAAPHRTSAGLRVTRDPAASRPRGLFRQEGRVCGQCPEYPLAQPASQRDARFPLITGNSSLPPLLASSRFSHRRQLCLFRAMPLKGYGALLAYVAALKDYPERPLSRILCLATRNSGPCFGCSRPSSLGAGLGCPGYRQSAVTQASGKKSERELSLTE